MPIRDSNGMKVEYVPQEWNGVNTSRIRLVGKCILVLPDVCVKSAGGVSFDPQMEHRLNMGSDSGIIVAVAPGAFLLNEDMTPWTGEKPKPGDLVYIEKYAGRVVTGADGRDYRMMDYASVGAIYEPATTVVPEGPKEEIIERAFEKSGGRS